MRHQYSQRSVVDDWPPFYFRPSLFNKKWDLTWGDSPYSLLTGQDKREYDVYRYDEETDQVVPDDGRPALAFGIAKGSWYRYLRYEVPRFDNTLYYWYSAGGVRHVVTRNGKRGRGDEYRDYDSHPNLVASEAIRQNRGLEWWKGALNGETFDPSAISLNRKCYRVTDQTIMRKSEVKSIMQKCVDCKDDNYGHRLNKWMGDHADIHMALDQERDRLKKYERDIEHSRNQIEVLQQMSFKHMEEMPEIGKPPRDEEEI